MPPAQHTPHMLSSCMMCVLSTGVSVTDDSSLQLVEPRVQSPRLPVMVLLEDEVWCLSVCAESVKFAQCVRLDKLIASCEVFFGSASFSRVVCMCVCQARVPAHINFILNTIRCRCVNCMTQTSTLI